MRPSLLLCSLLLCLGCARSMEPRERNGGTEAHDAGQPSTETAPAAQEPSPAGGECRSDEDCAITQVPEGDCCPRLCTGRVVTAAEARRLEAGIPECEARNPCPALACARPRTRPVAVCTAGRCATQHLPMEAP